MERLLKDGRLFKMLAWVDADLLEMARAGGCASCGARVHRSDYRRKPRCGPSEWQKRGSLCCERDGCRKRKTPPSVRFLGRRVYAGVVVVLVSAMVQGLSPARVARIRQELGIDKRTLARWRQWWLDGFVSSRFWQAARARLMPLADERRLPLVLVERFGAHRREGLVKLMKFLCPLTTNSCKEVWAM